MHFAGFRRSLSGHPEMCPCRHPIAPASLSPSKAWVHGRRKEAKYLVELLALRCFSALEKHAPKRDQNVTTKHACATGPNGIRSTHVSNEWVRCEDLTPHWVTVWKGHWLSKIQIAVHLRKNMWMMMVFSLNCVDWALRPIKRCWWFLSMRAVSKWRGRELQPNVMRINKCGLPEVLVTNGAQFSAPTGCASENPTAESIDVCVNFESRRGRVFS